MLRPRQIAICAMLAFAFWAVAALAIHFDPGSVGPGLRGDLGFAIGIPLCWLCIWLTCRLARLEPVQIPLGCLVVLSDAMLLDGVALRWFPTIYSADDHVGRLGAAWLLWGYGISAWIALFIAERRTKASGTGPALHPALN